MPPTTTPEKLRDQVAAILRQSDQPAHKRLAQIHALFDVPRTKRGRKPLGGEACRLACSSDYQKARRQQAHANRRCNACGKVNERHPLTRCQACADKYRRPSKREAMSKRLADA